MTVTNARPSPFLQLSSDSDLDQWTSGMGCGDGVIMNPTTSLAPSLDGAGRNAVMAAGSCLIKGKLWSCDASVNTAIPAASGSNRIDRLTMRLTRTAANATAFLQPNIITGTPSGSPVIPSLVQTPTGIWDLPIAHWTSASSGALTGLVDERFDPGKNMQSGVAANMPLWHVRPVLYYQTDTGILMIWNGSSWAPVSPQPSAWQTMPTPVNSWSVSGHAQYRLTVNGDLQVSFKSVNCGAVSDGTLVWNTGAITSAYQVNNAHRVTCYSDAIKSISGGNLESSAFEFQSDGSVQCYGFSVAASRADLYATIPIV